MDRNDDLSETPRGGGISGRLMEEACAHYAARDARGAMSSLLLATQAKPSDPTPLRAIAQLHAMAGFLDTAIGFAHAAIALDPADHESHAALGDVLVRAGRDADALEAFTDAFRLEPKSLKANLGLAEAAHALDRRPLALHHIAHVLSLRPENPRALLLRAFIELQSGDLARGFATYEARFQADPKRYADFDHARRWTGGSLEGRRVLVASEQGFGDLFQFLRFVRHLKRLGAITVVEANRPALPLLRQLAFVDEACAKGGTRPAYDVMIPLMSLARDLGHTRPDDLWRGTYVPRDRRPGGTDLRVGIAWRGSPTNRMDKRRSIEIQALAPVFAVSGVQFVGLAVDVDRREEDQLVALGVREGLPRGCDFETTRRALSGLDAVVSVDTSVAHLAGAMGIPVHLMLCLSPDWRWGLKTSTTQWYPATRLHRQRVHGDWRPVVAEVTRAIADMAAVHARPLALGA